MLFCQDTLTLFTLSGLTIVGVTRVTVHYTAFYSENAEHFIVHSCHGGVTHQPLGHCYFKLGERRRNGETVAGHKTMLNRFAYIYSGQDCAVSHSRPIRRLSSAA